MSMFSSFLKRVFGIQETNLTPVVKQSAQQTFDAAKPLVYEAIDQAVIKATNAGIGFNAYNLKQALKQEMAKRNVQDVAQAIVLSLVDSLDLDKYKDAGLSLADKYVADLKAKISAARL